MRFLDCARNDIVKNEVSIVKLKRCHTERSRSVDKNSHFESKNLNIVLDGSA